MHRLNDFVWCKLAASPIHGIGVFAIRDIPKGTYLFEGSVAYPRTHEETILPEIMELIRDHWIDADENTVLRNPNWDAHLQCYMNHSYDANSNGHYALRDIKKGEEVTEDYTKLSTPLGEKARKHYSFL